MVWANAFIRIDRQGLVTLVIPQTEMGQGIYTGLAMVLAEELDVGADQVVLETAPPNDKLYANPIFGLGSDGGLPLGRQDRRMASSDRWVRDYCPLARTGVPEGSRHRCGGRGRRSALRHAGEESAHGCRN
jgi:molybdopterin-binding aldehyde dehydrogenase-like protein